MNFGNNTRPSAAKLTFSRVTHRPGNAHWQIPMRQFYIIVATTEILSIPIQCNPKIWLSPQFVHTVHRLHDPHPWVWDLLTQPQFLVHHHQRLPRCNAEVCWYLVDFPHSQNPPQCCLQMGVTGFGVQFPHYLLLQLG